jgi:hypothetical protein
VQNQQSSLTTHYTWAYIIDLVKQHKKELISAHLLAILATIATVPVPLLMPLLVDEILLNNPGIMVATINQFTPANWHTPILYISAILLVSLCLRVIGIIFNIIQLRQFSVTSHYPQANRASFSELPPLSIELGLMSGFVVSPYSLSISCSNLSICFCCQASTSNSTSTSGVRSSSFISGSFGLGYPDIIFSGNQHTFAENAYSLYCPACYWRLFAGAAYPLSWV